MHFPIGRNYRHETDGRLICITQAKRKYTRCIWPGVMSAVHSFPWSRARAPRWSWWREPRERFARKRPYRGRFPTDFPVRFGAPGAENKSLIRSGRLRFARAAIALEYLWIRNQTKPPWTTGQNALKPELIIAIPTYMSKLYSNMNASVSPVYKWYASCRRSGVVTYRWNVSELGGTRSCLRFPRAENSSCECFPSRRNR